MKIIVVSLFGYQNFGNVCQNYALTKYVSNRGYTTYLLNYNVRFDKSELPLLAQIKYHMVWFIINRLICIKRNKFKKFIKANIRLTRHYKTYSAIKENPPEADLYLIGSDQVWNPYFNGNGTYFLRWVREGLKMSYSASIGESKLNKSVLNDLCDALKDFRYIAVREDTGKELLTEAEVKDVMHVMDPVFLIDVKEWEKLLRPNKYGKYILTLSYEKNDMVHKVIKKLKEKTGFKIIEIANSTQKYGDIADKFFRNLGVEEILSLIKNAEIVITTAFHATAFSLIFNVNFVSVLSKRTPSRQTSLLKICRLEDRAISEDDIIDIKKLLKSPEWTKINDRINKKILESKEWLNLALEDCERSLS